MRASEGRVVLDEPVEEVEARLGYTFRDRSLLERALTHVSRAHEEGTPESNNERLEFLGDAVLDLIVSEWLMREHPDADEGVLSQARARTVNTGALAERAAALGLDRALRLGRGERRSGGHAKASLRANVFEAVIGAVYLDAGLEAARALAERELEETLRELPDTLADAKTRLQELLQSRGEGAPRYAILAESGPDHAKEFDAEVAVAGRVLGQGRGRSKQDAEREAARQALRELES